MTVNGPQGLCSAGEVEETIQKRAGAGRHFQGFVHGAHAALIAHLEAPLVSLSETHSDFVKLITGGDQIGLGHVSIRAGFWSGRETSRPGEKRVRVDLDMDDGRVTSATVNESGPPKTLLEKLQFWKSNV